MNKKLLALAVGSVMLPTVALADISIYGRAHVSLDHLDNGGDYSEMNLSSNSSRLGFKGDTKLGNSSLTAFFQIESEINFTSGGSSASDWTSRDTFVGLRGDFGSIRAGQFDSPFKAARGPANLFGDQLGDMRNMTRVGDGRFEERMPNTIEYKTPSFDGLQLALAYSLHEGSQKGTNPDGADDKDQGLSAALLYANGNFEGTLAYENYSEDANRGERNSVRAAAGYKFGDFKLVGFYQTISHDVDEDQEADIYGLGGEFKATEKTYLRAMYITRDAEADDASADMIAVGVEHRLDKAFRVYANYAVVMNDDNAGLTPWAQARTAKPAGSNGDDAKGLSLGVRYDF